MFSLSRKSLNCNNLPPALKWVENYSLKYSYKRYQKDWIPLFKRQDQTSEIKLYTQSISSKDRVLILPCILQDFDLFSLVSELNNLGVACNVLLPNKLFFTIPELTQAKSLIGSSISSFAVGFSFNSLQSELTNCLVYNSIPSPSLFFSGLSCAKDKEMILSVRKNYKYLYKQELELKYAFPADINELVPLNAPDLAPSACSVFYETSQPLHDFPSVSENSSRLTAMREPLLAQMLKALVNNHIKLSL